MADRHLHPANGNSASGQFGGAAPFFVGLVVALILGWWAFPQMLYSQKHQPVRFSHKVHMEGAGMECSSCHFLREDGTFAGLPTTESCAECHSEPMGSDPEEVRFIEEYVNTGKEVEWLVYQKQPDNVFFSHAAHSMDSCNKCHEFTETELCSTCHPNVAETDEAPVYYENKLTKYSKQTMKMWRCEECHAHPEHYGTTRSSNACYVCHK
ncbi:MAG: menaquinone reductase multiheme cytochrome c subunit QrcA [Halodesulfovibrio sp.]